MEDTTRAEAKESININRRSVLRNIGVVSAGTLIGTGTVGGSNGGGQHCVPSDEQRTIEWDGQRGDEYADGCGDLGRACWKWILTPGGPCEFTSVEKLEVKFSDGETISVEGQQQGNGAYQFEVCRDLFGEGGTINDASVVVEGGGSNALLTISDVECTEYWQVDFATGLQPPEPPDYSDPEYNGEFIIAAIGSSEGVSYNPSCSALPVENVEVTSGNGDGKFNFDDSEAPTEVTIEFDVTSDEAQDLHLAVFERPPEEDFNEDYSDSCPRTGKELTINVQEKFEVDNGTFGGTGNTLTASLPTPGDSL